MRKITVLAFSLIALGFAGSRFFYFPRAVEPARIRVLETVAQQPALMSGQRLKILLWNIQFFASKKYHFFYEGGKDVSTEKSVVEKTAQGIADLVKQINPDILMVQEIDFSARRTHYLNEVDLLQDKVGYRFSVYAPHWKCGYVPFPDHEHIGSINSGLAMFTSLPVADAQRHDLGLKAGEPFYKSIFSLRRAIVEMKVPYKMNQYFVLFNTHLEAYASSGVGKLDQVKKIDQLLTQEKNRGNIALIGGDFNLLPPSVDPKKLDFEGEYFNSPQDNPLNYLLDRHKSAIDMKEYEKNPDRYNAYVPPLHAKADRLLDHIFLDSSIKIISCEIVARPKDLSDHYPILLEVELP